MQERLEQNRRVIEEFRANNGRVGGAFAGTPLLLLTTVGARTGRHLTTPLAYLRDGARLIVFAANGGRPTQPAWYANLRANRRATVELGHESVAMLATELGGDERDRLWGALVAQSPDFAGFQAATARSIPVIALERATS